jgi:hypothetical protein
VVANLGYCGLDRTRAALTGDEIRPCWEARTAESAAAALPVVAPLWLDEGLTRRS